MQIFLGTGAARRSYGNSRRESQMYYSAKNFTTRQSDKGI